MFTKKKMNIIIFVLAVILKCHKLGISLTTKFIFLVLESGKSMIGCWLI